MRNCTFHISFGFVFITATLWCGGLGAQSLKVNDSTSQTLQSHQVHKELQSPFEGMWSYRSFHSNPDLSVPPNELLFGSGTLRLTQPNLTSVEGTLGGEGWSLDILGTADIGGPPTIRFQGKGNIGGEEWIYDYVGYLVPRWPNGIDQRPAIVGSIVRTKEHSQGRSKAGYVAQWIAVLQDAPKEHSPHDGKQKPSDNNDQSRSLKPFVPAIESYLDELKQLPQKLQSFESRKAASGEPYQPYLNPPERKSLNGLLDTELHIRYADNEIWNPKLEKPIRFHHRSYDGKLVGDTLRVAPGDMLRVAMRNGLPEDRPHHGPLNEPHGFNTTNLHTHGLHVSPSGNSDNVFVSVRPGAEFQNEIYVPKSQPAGTFWYHAHVHGSTAIQVSSGMAGALIVEGGIDTLPSIAAAREQVLLFQQIPYTQSQSSDTYELESYQTFGPGQWDPGTVNNGWRTTISGQLAPLFAAAPGQVLRLRLIDAGLREDIDFCILPYREALKLAESQRARELDESKRVGTLVADTNAETDKSAIPLHEVSADGLAYGRVWQRPSIPLSPGYRSDVLVKVQDPGLYVLIDKEASSETSLHATHNAPKLLGVLVVSGDPVAMSLPTNEELASFKPHKHIEDAEVDISAPQVAEFNIDTSKSPPIFEINSKEFDPLRPARELQLGKASEWKLRSNFVNHPFHIHVNPFEITSLRDSDGNEQLPTDPSGRIVPIWKDTILVRQGSEITLRTRHEDYVGRFVLHCHILDHEDRGMMETVEILIPGGGHGH